MIQRALNNFYEVHESEQLLLSDYVKESERIDWFEPKRATFTEFMNEVELWRKRKNQLDLQTLINPSDSSSIISKG